MQKLELLASLKFFINTPLLYHYLEIGEFIEAEKIVRKYLKLSDDIKITIDGWQLKNHRGVW